MCHPRSHLLHQDLFLAVLERSPVKMSPLTSVIVVSHNHKDYIIPCIKSILDQDYSAEIIIVDNGLDGTSDLVRKTYPSVKVIKTEKNLGYAGGNNLGVLNSDGKFIVILNPDTIVEKGWLEELVKPLENEEKLITTPKILTYDGSIINTCGNINHFTGLTFVRGYGERSDKYAEFEYVSGFSGCCFAIRKSDFYEIGLFDETFFIYNEDSEFSWRAHVKGYKILYVPTAQVKHNYVLKVNPKKLFYLERNRYMMIRKYYSKKDFVELFPSIFIVEVLIFGYSVRLGRRGLYYKLKAMNDGLRVSVLKVEGDRKNLLKSLSPAIPVHQLTFNKIDELIKVFSNKIFELNVIFV